MIKCFVELRGNLSNSLALMTHSHLINCYYKNTDLCRLKKTLRDLSYTVYWIINDSQNGYLKAGF